MRKKNESGRPRGILTERDRTYLRLSEAERKEEFSPSARSRARSDIKERVWHGFLDGRVLFDNLTEAERQRLFRSWEEFADPIESEADDDDRPANFGDVAESRGEWVERIRAGKGFAGFLALLYLGLDDSDQFDFSEALERAVRRAERSRGREVTAFDLTIESEAQPSIEELRTRFVDREELTTAQIRRLTEADVVNGDELAAYYEEYQARGDERV